MPNRIGCSSPQYINYFWGCWDTVGDNQVETPVSCFGCDPEGTGSPITGDETCCLDNFPKQWFSSFK